MKQLGILLLSLCVLAVPAKSQPGLITNAQLAGGIDLTTKVAGVLPPANGGFLCTLSPCINQQPMVTPGSLGIGTTYGVMQAGATTVNWDFNNTGLAIGRNITTNQTAGQAQNALWVQEDFSGATGTPWAFATRLKVSNDNCTNGCAASANYVEADTGVTGVAIAVHGQCDINYVAAGTLTCIGINAEGSTTIASAIGGLIGVESNMNLIPGAGTDSTVFGVQIQMNNGNLLGPLSSGVEMQANDHTIPFGLVIQDGGGQFAIPAVITSTQSSPGDLVLVNALAGTGPGSSNIWFQRSVIGDDGKIRRERSVGGPNPGFLTGRSFPGSDEPEADGSCYFYKHRAMCQRNRGDRGLHYKLEYGYVGIYYHRHGRESRTCIL